MDGNGRWANERGLPRTEGHRAGEAALVDVVAGAIELGSNTSPCTRSPPRTGSAVPEEVRFLMGFSRDVLRRQRASWRSGACASAGPAGEPRLWKSVVNELRDAEDRDQGQQPAPLTMCVNYGGRAEIADAVAAIAARRRRRQLKPSAVSEKTVARYLDEPDLPDVDLFLRTSGEQRTSNFMLWQSAYAEMVFMDVLWPDVDRRTLWEAPRSTPAATAATAAPWTEPRRGPCLAGPGPAARSGPAVLGRRSSRPEHVARAQRDSRGVGRPAGRPGRGKMSCMAPAPAPTDTSRPAPPPAGVMVSTSMTLPARVSSCPPCRSASGRGSGHHRHRNLQCPGRLPPVRPYGGQPPRRVTGKEPAGAQGCRSQCPCPSRLIDCQ